MGSQESLLSQCLQPLYAPANLPRAHTCAHTFMQLHAFFQPHNTHRDVCKIARSEVAKVAFHPSLGKGNVFHVLGQRRTNCHGPSHT